MSLIINMKNSSTRSQLSFLLLFNGQPLMLSSNSCMFCSNVLELLLELFPVVSNSSSLQRQTCLWYCRSLAVSQGNGFKQLLMLQFSLGHSCSVMRVGYWIGNWENRRIHMETLLVSNILNLAPFIVGI